MTIPLNAFRTPDGHVIALTYGVGADWVKNVLASGEAQLEYGGRIVMLDRPELVGRDEAWNYIPRAARMALRLLRVDDFLSLRARVDAVTPG